MWQSADERSHRGESPQRTSAVVYQNSNASESAQIIKNKSTNFVQLNAGNLKHDDDDNDVKLMMLSYRFG